MFFIPRDENIAFDVILASIFHSLNYQHLPNRLSPEAPCVQLRSFSFLHSFKRQSKKKYFSMATPKSWSCDFVRGKRASFASQTSNVILHSISLTRRIERTMAMLYRRACAILSLSAICSLHLYAAHWLLLCV